MKYIGIDIGATNLKAGLVDDAGQILAKQKMKIARLRRRTYWRVTWPE